MHSCSGAPITWKQRIPNGLNSVNLFFRCGHCKQLAPQYAKAAKRMKENDPPVPFAKVDATEEKDLGTRYEVKGYPTLKVFRKGEAHDYDGPRDEEGTE